MNPAEVIRGDSPVILAVPHSGTWLPADMPDRLTPLGRTLGDTDWHVDILYEGLLPGATTVRANFHRYLIDANRDPAGASLYPGQNTTGLCPLTDFDDRPLYRAGAEPDEAEIAARSAEWHAPYHVILAGEIARVREAHGIAILYDCHSIRSHIPFLFEGTLPDFNIGTNGTATCDPRIEAAVAGICAAADGYTSVVNGRFRGGWTTRHYGRPQDGIHAIQMELAQSTHLATQAPPFSYDPDKAERLRTHLRAILNEIEGLAMKLAAETGGKP